MRKSLLLFIALISLNSLKAQVLNGGFEAWTANLPDNWYGIVIPGYNLLSQTTAAHSGTYAVNMHVDDGGGGQPIATFLTTGNGTTGTHPLTIVPGSLSFWYRFASVGSDDFSVTAVVYSGGNAVGAGTGDFPAAANYTNAAIPVTYGAVPATADSIAIYFFITNLSGTPHIGSDAQLDDVTLSVGAGIDDHTASADFRLMPNPADEYINIEFSSALSDCTLYITDLTGKQALSKSVEGDKMKIETSGFAQGMYRWTVRGKKSYGGVFVVNHQ